jgi:cell division protein FtsZ
MDGAHGVLLSIAGGSDLGLFEINEAASLVQEAAHEDANIIFGTVIDDSLGDEVRVTVIAAGFDSSPSVLPPSIDQRVRASNDRVGVAGGRLGGGGHGAPNGGGRESSLNGNGNGGFSSHPQREPQMPPQPQYATTPPPPPRGAAPAYQQQAPGRYPAQAAGQHQGVPNGRGRTQVDLDDDDVDVPSFMKR